MQDMARPASGGNERPISGGNGDLDAKLREAIYDLGRSGEPFTVYRILSHAGLPVNRATANRASGLVRSALIAGLLEDGGLVTARPEATPEDWLRTGAAPKSRKAKAYKGAPALTSRRKVS